jgi:hypothetical protein
LILNEYRNDQVEGQEFVGREATKTRNTCMVNLEHHVPTVRRIDRFLCGKATLVTWDVNWGISEGIGAAEPMNLPYEFDPCFGNHPLALR